MYTTPAAALEALNEALLAIASEQSVDPILQKLVHEARALVRARFAALGIPDGRGGFEKFLTSGMSDADMAAIGPLPDRHGMLDGVLQSTESMRSPDLQQDPRFRGWPANHPAMRSLLGVPIVSKGQTIAAFYLTEKKGATGFSDADQELIERFAAHAAIAIENARLLEKSRELSIVEERNRLARDLHDSVTQTLFSLTLTAEAAVQLIGSDPEQARKQVEKVQGLAKDALSEMRSLVFELRPADLGTDGLVPTLRKHLDIVRRVYGTEVELDVPGEPRLEPSVELTLFRIVQEALNNALKHGRADHVGVKISLEAGLVRASVIDDGIGFEPRGIGVRTKHLGLTSMEERAHGLGGSLRIDSAPGEGTRVSFEVPL